MTGPGHRLRATAGPELLDTVQDELGRVWAGAPARGAGDVDDVDRMLFETALVEVLGNLVEHAHTSVGAAVRVELDLAVHPDRVEATLVDDGVWPPDAVLDGAALPEDELAESGRGLALAAAAADITHTRVDGGNRWTVVRRRISPGR
jgi:serine/threonine-protein kinase RsbW